MPQVQIPRQSRHEVKMRDKISRVLSNKPFSVHRDETKSIKVAGKEIGKRGHETFINGQTGAVQVVTVTKTGQDEDTIYTAKIVIPVSGNYSRKNFTGVGFEHPNDESWPINFNLNVEWINALDSLGPNDVSDKGVTGSNKSADHDSIKWAKDEVNNQLVQKLKQAGD